MTDQFPALADFDFRPRPIPIPWDRPVFEFRWPKARVRILVVADGSGSFDRANNFGLGMALEDALETTTHPDFPSYVTFEVTKAHRSSAAGADINNFRFREGTLGEYDEVWLFGVSATSPYLDQPSIPNDPNSVTEKEVLEAFMDAGGGVLAMGDHQNLGLGLCGDVKRVRSMRKWWWNDPNKPAGMEEAPHAFNLDRNDTVQAPAPGGDVNMGQQFDGTPQPIYPVYSYRWRFGASRPFARVKYPHPVLCGPRGVIKVMPDHQHEGDCIEPHSNFAGEFPGGVDAEVIAHGRNVVGRTKSGYTVTQPRQFGLIGAWDGHSAGGNYGRVLVDSTWHHWFNINLRGLESETPTTEYDDILAYFRNCAIWLARPERHRDMKRAGQLVTLYTPQLIEHVLTLDDFRPAEFYLWGTYARDALGRIAPRCQSAAWIWELTRPLLNENLLDRFFKIKEQVDKGDIDPVEEMLDDAVTEVAAMTMLGGVFQALALQVKTGTVEEAEDLAKKMDGRFEKLAEEGGKRAADYLEKRLKGFDKRLAKACA